jgi:hypothetical protein
MQIDQHHIAAMLRGFNLINDTFRDFGGFTASFVFELYENPGVPS